MGHENSKGLTAEDVNQLRDSTHFTPQEISDWHERFHENYPNGVITRPQFIRMYSEMFPNTDAHQYAENIFRAYDMDGNGTIDFTEFMCTLSVSSKGSAEEKLEWTFKLYDRDGSGDISMEEATDIICAIYKMQGEPLAREKAQDTSSELFVHLDKNKDSRLSKREFMHGAMKSSGIMSMLNPE